ncbi:MAG: citrate/2-methylcitrate synthase [Methanobacteriaceae archaeon]
MAIGKSKLESVLKVRESKWKTSITKIDSNELETRGYAQEDLIENLAFSEMVFLLLRSELPNEKQTNMMRHILVSFCDHGLTPPSTQVARLIASSGSPLTSAVAGAFLSFGKNHAGAIGDFMEVLESSISNFDPKALLNDKELVEGLESKISEDELITKNLINENNNSNSDYINVNNDGDIGVNVNNSDDLKVMQVIEGVNINNMLNNHINSSTGCSDDTKTIDEMIDDEILKSIAMRIVDDFETKNIKVPGFGHRYHDFDPRATKLIELAEKNDSIGIYTKLALAIEEILFEKKNIKLNIDGVNAGLLLDMGFDSSLGSAIFMIGRIPGLIAHTREEMNNEREFRKFCDIDDIDYYNLDEKRSI